MFGALYLYFKKNAQNFGVRVIRKMRAIGRKIRYIDGPKDLKLCTFD
jgi:hypothetical protein